MSTLATDDQLDGYRMAVPNFAEQFGSCQINVSWDMILSSTSRANILKIERRFLYNSYTSLNKVVWYKRIAVLLKTVDVFTTHFTDVSDKYIKVCVSKFFRFFFFSDRKLREDKRTETKFRLLLFKRKNLEHALKLVEQESYASSLHRT